MPVVLALTASVRSCLRACLSLDKLLSSLNEGKKNSSASRCSALLGSDACLSKATALSHHLPHNIDKRLSASTQIDETVCEYEFAPCDYKPRVLPWVFASVNRPELSSPPHCSPKNPSILMSFRFARTLFAKAAPAAAGQFSGHSGKEREVKRRGCRSSFFLSSASTGAVALSPSFRQCEGHQICQP